MEHTLQRIAAAFLLLVLFLSPTSALAREKRGADLLIILKDGRQARGELIAVKQDALLLLGFDAKDQSIGIPDIATIRIVRRSKAWQGLLYGFVPGAVGGAILGGTSGDDMAGLAATLVGLVFGATTGLVGLAAGMGAGIDADIDLAGLPEAERDRVLARLNRQAREPGVYVPKQVETPAGLLAERPMLSSREWTRFRLTWMPGFRVGGRGYFWEEEGTVPFRFTEDLPPGEAGPYLSTWYWAENNPPTFSLGHVTLSYQWSRRFASEIEFHVSNHTTYHLADLRFTSTLDGLTYLGTFGSYEIVRSTSLLIGLSYRPFPPAFLQPHVFEIGVAAGPAWIGTALSDWLFGEDPVGIDRTMAWTARARVSYDYHFSPAFSMGAFAEYRWLQADIPSYEASEYLDFQEGSDAYGKILMRTTAVTIPERALALGGFACGLRLGFGF
jgi:hypothetical protein